MTEQTEQAPEYKAPPVGAYSVEEHLRAQQEQTNPRDGKPLHEPQADPEPSPEPADTATEQAVTEAGTE